MRATRAPWSDRARGGGFERGDIGERVRARDDGVRVLYADATGARGGGGVPESG